MSQICIFATPGRTVKIHFDKLYIHHEFGIGELKCIKEGDDLKFLFMRSNNEIEVTEKELKDLVEVTEELELLIAMEKEAGIKILDKVQDIKNILITKQLAAYQETDQEQNDIDAFMTFERLHHFHLWFLKIYNAKEWKIKPGSFYSRTVTFKRYATYQSLKMLLKEKGRYKSDEQIIFIFDTIHLIYKTLAAICAQTKDIWNRAKLIMNYRLSNNEYIDYIFYYDNKLFLINFYHNANFTGEDEELFQRNRILLASMLKENEELIGIYSFVYDSDNEQNELRSNTLFQKIRLHFHTNNLYLKISDKKYLLVCKEKNKNMIGNTTNKCNNVERDFRDRYEARHRAEDGHLVRSQAELLIDNYFFNHGIMHIYEKKVYTHDDSGVVYIADFYLPTEDIYIEYWGILGSQRYDKKMEEKKKMYIRNGIKVINIYPENLKAGLDDFMSKELMRYKKQGKKN